MWQWIAQSPGSSATKSKARIWPTAQSIETLDLLWTWPPGHFARASYAPQMKIAFANYGVSLGLQAAGLWPVRVERLNAHFETWRSGDDYDREAITWVMACTAHLPTAFLKEPILTR